MAKEDGDGTLFSPEQVLALLESNAFPYADGFAWETVEYFRYTAGYFQPFRGDEMLPGPALYGNAGVNASAEAQALEKDLQDLPWFLRKQAD